MSPPEGPVTRLDHCFAVLVVTDVIRWEWGAHETKGLSGYIHSSWHGNAWISSQGKGFSKSDATLWAICSLLMENS